MHHTKMYIITGRHERKKEKNTTRNNSNHRKIKGFNHLPQTETLEKLYDELQTKVGATQQKEKGNRQSSFSSSIAQMNNPSSTRIPD
jgi:alanine racemase